MQHMRRSSGERSGSPPEDGLREGALGQAAAPFVYPAGTPDAPPPCSPGFSGSVSVLWCVSLTCSLLPVLPGFTRAMNTCARYNFRSSVGFKDDSCLLLLVALCGFPVCETF